MSRKRILWIFAILYAAGFFLTLGYGINRACSWDNEVIENADGSRTLRRGWGEDCNHSDHNAIPGSPLWPGYWALRGAMEVTKP